MAMAGINNKWNELHDYYKTTDWIGKPNIFAQEVLEYFPEKGKILCLGDGQGQDGRFFASKGYNVVSTDISESAMQINSQKIKEEALSGIEVKKLDLEVDFPFPDETFDIVYAHLSLHYFSEEVTVNIFKKIGKVLKRGGIFAAFVNSVSDPEFNTGKKLEQEYFEIEGVNKRFFSVYSMDYFARDFRVLLLDDKGRTYKDEAKGVHNLVRFVGKNYPRRALNIALPAVTAIIEREVNGEKEVLIQTRWRPSDTDNYHNKIELVSGVLDKPYENIFEVVKREVKEETGLTVTEIVNLEKTDTYTPSGDAAFAFKPFTAFQQLKGGRAWVGFAFVVHVADGEIKFQEDETRDPRWIKKSALKELVKFSPEKFFTLNLGVLAVYLND
jgi:SAM-dependent methyltransferase